MSRFIEDAEKPTLFRHYRPRNTSPYRAWPSPDRISQHYAPPFPFPFLQSTADPKSVPDASGIQKIQQLSLAEKIQRATKPLPPLPPSMSDPPNQNTTKLWPILLLGPNSEHVETRTAFPLFFPDLFSFVSGLAMPAGSAPKKNPLSAVRPRMPSLHRFRAPKSGQSLSVS